MEIGADPCPKLIPTWEVQPCLTADQTDPVKTLMGNTEKDIEDKICPNMTQ